METPNEHNRESVPAEAAKHIKSAHQILETLQQKIGKHPEIGAECFGGADWRTAVAVCTKTS